MGEPRHNATFRFLVSTIERLGRLAVAGQTRTDIIEQAVSEYEERHAGTWSGALGGDRVALQIMALQDAIAAGISQEEAEQRLVAQLLRQERDRRLAAMT